ncbi:MAG: VWA domain-containing protein [Acidobacteriaceae bacterium]|nr:VWA domain-containing protein [Acidobacteriaceae bacterium]
MSSQFAAPSLVSSAMPSAESAISPAAPEEAQIAAPSSALPAATPAPAATDQAIAAQQPPATAQPPQADSSDTASSYVFKRQTSEVNLIFTVTDKHTNQSIKNLQQQNFGLLDDGKPPLRVLSFKQQTNLPLRVGIVLDTSSSVRTRFHFEQEAATEFLLEILGHQDRAFIEGFDVGVDISQDFTGNIDKLNQGIQKLRPGGGTALYDAIYKTCRDQLLPLQSQEATRRAIILVSDGDDIYSHALESDAIKMCQRAETIIFAISTNVGPSKDKGDDVLKEMSEATGGQTFFPKRIEDVALGFNSIRDELRSQYSLVYQPSDFKMDGAFRTIYLQATDPRYVVHVRKGYFAQKAPQ